MPLKSMKSVTLRRSLPLTLRMKWSGSAPELTSCCIITPSMMTLGLPLTVTAITTRMMAIGAPPDSMNNVCRGEFLPSAKESSKPLSVSPEVTTTFASRSASSTSCETGMGTAGPIMRVRLIPFSTALVLRCTGHAATRGPRVAETYPGVAACSLRPGDAFRQGDADDRAGLLQLFRIQQGVRIAYAPELLGIADEVRGDNIEPFAFGHTVLL